MKRHQNASLKHLNSFSVAVRAGQLVELESTDDLKSFATEACFDPARDLLLGSGSNILLTGDVPGRVVINRLTGKKIVVDSGNEVVIEASAGENWHQLVLWSLDAGLSGLENLSLIPGSAGAAPIQNIGAYGVELASVIDAVTALDLTTGTACNFDREDCHFSYRDSRFKSVDYGRYMITGMRMRLQRKFSPKLSYAGLREELQRMNIHQPTARQVSDAVIRIRRRKLPDPAQTANAGSFFKNPMVDATTASRLMREFEGLPAYPQSDQTHRLSAAWMIEHCGWRGYRQGDAGVSSQHALVLVNYGSASGMQILDLAKEIINSVKACFGIELKIEPQIIGPQNR